MDKVVHFEIPVDNMDRAKKFYSIFGWKVEEFPEMDYVIVRTVEADKSGMPKEPGAINGGMMLRSEKVRAPVIAINVDSIEEAVKKVLKAGGKVVVPKMEVGGMGYYTYVSDTEGNVIGLWETKM